VILLAITTMIQTVSVGKNLYFIRSRAFRTTTDQNHYGRHSKQAVLAQTFRVLTHPGRAARLVQRVFMDTLGQDVIDGPELTAVKRTLESMLLPVL
jgi:hypothetical protein